MQTLIKFLNKFHLYYLGAMPALATFLLIPKTNPNNGTVIAIFLVGIAVVGVYLAMLGSYTKPIQNLPLLLLTICDGPFFGLLATQNLNNLDNLIIYTFLIENLAIWLSLPVVALSVEHILSQQIIAVFVLSLVILASFGAFFALTDILPYSVSAVLALLGGVFESFVLKYKILAEDDVVRAEATVAVYILIFLALWVFSLFLSVGIFLNH